MPHKIGDSIFDTAHLDPRFHAELVVQSVEDDNEDSRSILYHCEVVEGYKVGTKVLVRGFR
jgi:hypothetical protein